MLRGGYGRFIQTLLGSAVENAWAVESSDVAFFNNSFNTNGTPCSSCLMPGPPTSRNLEHRAFMLRRILHYKDPYVQEWDITLERDLGANFGLRVSYDGNHGSDLGVQYNVKPACAQHRQVSTRWRCRFLFR